MQRDPYLMDRKRYEFNVITYIYSPFWSEFHQTDRTVAIISNCPTGQIFIPPISLSLSLSVCTLFLYIIFGYHLTWPNKCNPILWIEEAEREKRRRENWARVTISSLCYSVQAHQRNNNTFVQKVWTPQFGSE